MSSKISPYGFLWMILFFCYQASLSANLPDTSQVFYQDMTFNGFLDKAILFQQRADSLRELSVAWRKEVTKMDDPVRRAALQKRIVQAEDSVEIYKEMARLHFAYMNDRLPIERLQNPYLVKDTALDGMTVYQYKLTDEFLARLDEKTRAISIPAEIDPSGTRSNFKIYDQTPYRTAKTFEYDFPLPAGVFYRIQLAVYKTRLAPDHFKGLSPITTEKIPGKNLIRYFVGKFYTLKDARRGLEKVRAYGYRDAYIVGYYDGKKGTFEKLQELERHP